MYRIVKKEALKPTVILYEIEAPMVAKKAQPGQFIILRVDENGERIPITIHDYDREKGTVTIIVQTVGATTEKLAHLNEGDFVTVIGSNGAGKSTLFNAIAGSFYVDEGRILLNGKDITFTREHDRSRVIGRLFQDPLRGTAPHMSIEENLALAYLRAAHGNPFSRITAKDRELFRAQLAQLDMGLEDRLGQPVGLLSGGQRQALTLLMATMVPPELLLLDEHTAALDPGTAEKVLALTQRVVAEHHITCLMVTHNMTQALALGNRTLMMADGGIVLDVAGAERAGMTVEDLVERFRAGTGRTLDNDRMLLSE